MSLLFLKNADVYAPRHLGRQNLLVAGGRILWMGADPFELPGPLRAVATEIDLAGSRLIPGLIDGHVHVTGGGGEAGFATRVPPVPLSRFTTSGVTTVIGLLGTDDVARSTRELLAGIYALREEGIAAWGYTGGYHLPPTTLSGSVRADLTFIEPLIGIGEVALSDHRSSQPTCAELLRIAADAHVAGMMTGKAGIVHLHLGDGSRGLALVREALAGSELPPRVFQPTHVNRRRALFEEAVALARAGSCIDLTAYPAGDDEDGYGAAEALERYLASDAPPDHVTVSSDAGGCLPCFDFEGRVSRMDVGSAGALLACVREAVERGLPLEAVLPAFTANPARLLRLAGKGIIRPGADADLVALDATGAVELTIARGSVHMRDGALVRRGFFET